MIRSALVASFVSLVVVGCSSGDGTDPSTSGGNESGGETTATQTGSASADLLQRCVDDINAYRAKIGKKAYARSSALETFAAEGAKSDAQTGKPHGHFIATSGGNGTAFAENEVPGWPLPKGGLAAVIDDGLAMMWGEGPGGGHYDNMASTSYTQVGCGTFVTASNDVWVTIDFK